MSRTPLSIIILTNTNDDRFIECLKSAQFADEVIVINNNSDNKFQILRKKYHFKLFQESQPINNFSLVRNKALTYAKHDWVFFLDSDEVIPEKSSRQIINLIKQNKQTAFTVKRVDTFYGKKLNWGEVRKVNKLRLALKSNIRFTRPIHETAESQQIPKQTSITILHTPHPSISSFFQKISFYSQLEAKYRKENSSSFSFLETVLYPPAKFFLNFFLKLGFLDGWRGLVYALMMSLHSLFVRISLYEVIATSKPDGRFDIFCYYGVPNEI